ncbi:alpha-ketoglutarate-dependent taurine dioxygenase [Calocera cornea HHB12733]|uniref:Alpha-ketoglutarate-dependent taurine dioxygenase n=1 Tax=Calocera cornea HHB12733 TaxID=1353952 RepID=A0A165DEP6_9BASI|nr:alpha-ketoglutarate-dependent taurine dioxygenase [Calocera cornea HHB12733]
MAPSVSELQEQAATPKFDAIQQIKGTLAKDIPQPPAPARARLDKAGIDYKVGYPYYPEKPKYKQEVAQIRAEERSYVDPGTRADPEKKALFGAAKEVRDLTRHIGTEIVGLQLKDLTDKQKDELGLLIAERTVVFFRDQDLSPQDQKKLGEYYGVIEVHPQAPQVPGVPGVSLIWEESYKRTTDSAAKQYFGNRNFRLAYPSGSFGWHTDLVHEPYPPGVTHLHQDSVPEVGGDTLWASGYAAYDKLSPTFRKLLDGLNGIYRSAHQYLDKENPDAPPSFVERVHPLVRTHPATGWKSLFINRAMTVGIEGLDKAESDAILNYLYDVYERNVDIQVRWHWTPGTSALWDNRVSIHTVSWDYEGEYGRHGTRVSSLAEKPYFDPKSKSRREALGLGP